MSKGTGYFIMPRWLHDYPVWVNSTPEQKIVLITAISLAGYTDREWEWDGEIYHLKRGQFITSYSSLAAKCGKGVTIQKVRTALRRFERLGWLTCQSTHHSTLITVEKYDLLQDPSGESNTPSDMPSTRAQHGANTALATTNKINKDENNKKEKRIFLDGNDPEHLAMVNRAIETVLKN